MAEVIKMPRLSDTMTEGVIAAWHVKVGDTVKNGDLLAEVETDKATMDVESFFDGTVLYIGSDEGGSILVGDLMVVVGDKSENVDDIIASAKEEVEEETEPEPTPAEAPASPEPAPVASLPDPTPAPVAAPTASSNGDSRVKASPLAKAMAKERGIDISKVSGTGDHGRVVKRDIESYVPSQAAASAPQGMIPTVVGEEKYEEKPVSQMRKTIAKRLSESKFTAPHFYLTMEINMDKAVEARKALNEVSPVKISFNDMVIRACAAALKKHPAVNAAWLGDNIRYNQHIHIGMAVAIDEGLLVPVIRFADSKGLAAIAAETKDLAGKARDRKLQPKDWEGNTFTVSNLGMFGIEEFTAIINPPDSCILAVGGILDKPVVKNGEIVPGKVMKVTLSCDHRVVDGMKGSEFLVTLKQLLEDPVRILV